MPGEGDCLPHTLQGCPALFSLFLILCPVPLLHPFLITDSLITAPECLILYLRKPQLPYFLSHIISIPKFIQAKNMCVHKCIYHTSTCVYTYKCVCVCCVFCTIRTLFFSLGQQSMLGIIFELLGSLNCLHYHLLLDAQGLLLCPKAGFCCHCCFCFWIFKFVLHLL